jgi:LPXTG-site transpeptidase (sortase) family protein
MIFVGLTDLLSRVLPRVPRDTGSTAFAPGIVALNPGLLTSLFATAPATADPITPAHLSIPSLGVDAVVEQVGVKDDGSMQNPSSFATVGWYKYGAKPGAVGHAVFAGHVNNALGLDGVFAHLFEVNIGDKIVVTDQNGSTLTYAVESKTQYDSQNAPRDEIFKVTGPSELVLITCEGDWIPSARSYNKRLVVLARLVR